MISGRQLTRKEKELSVTRLKLVAERRRNSGRMVLYEPGVLFGKDAKDLIHDTYPLARFGGAPDRLFVILGPAKGTIEGVSELTNQIAEHLIIPESLSANMRIERTASSGVSLSYCSDTTSELAMVNAKISFLIHFPVTDGWGVYKGEDISMKVLRKAGTCSLRSVKKEQHFSQIIHTVNNWLQVNEGALSDAVQNR